MISESESFTVLPVDAGTFDRPCEEFTRYADHPVSFIDYSNAVLSNEYEIEHVFAFDSDFRTPGLAVVSENIDEV